MNPMFQGTGMHLSHHIQTRHQGYQRALRMLIYQCLILAANRTRVQRKIQHSRAHVAIKIRKDLKVDHMMKIPNAGRETQLHTFHT